MDDSRFDAMTRSLSRHRNRRAMLRLLAGGLLGGLLSRREVTPARADEGCDILGLTFCALGPTTDATTGEVFVDGICVDLTSSVFHCGACGNACGVNQNCEIGVCVVPQCPAGTTDCSGYCADLLTSPVHCGACGTACAAGQSCQGGVCVGCVTGLTDCGGLCVDLSGDELNCGVCGQECAYGEICSGGGCGSLCAAGLNYCDGACVDYLTDPSHCGYCGRACLGFESCQGGACGGIAQLPPRGLELPCEARSLTDCGGVCVDLLTDNNNCGACGHACYPGLCGYGNGTCTVCTDDIVASGFCAANP
jgi:hypothetical protein